MTTGGVRIPFTTSEHAVHRSVTGTRGVIASLALDMRREKGTMRTKMLLPACALALALGATACGTSEEGTTTGSTGGGSGEGVSGKIAIDGSSTVAPFAQA